MTFKRLRHLTATLAVALFIPGGAARALADSENSTRATPPPATQTVASTRAAHRTQRIEDAWLGEQLRAAARTRANHK